MRVVKGPPKAAVMIIPSVEKKGELGELCLEAVAPDSARDEDTQHDTINQMEESHGS